MARDRLRSCIAFIALIAGMAHAQPAPIDPYRQALLIGVWDYEHESDLSSMEIDLTTLTGTFGQMQFDRIVPLRNPTQQEIESAIEDAARIASEFNGERAVLTVVYFGGHGAMVSNSSYLLASDFVRPADAASIIVSGGIRSDYVGERLSQMGQPALLIVEACRNPFVPSPLPQDGAEGAGYVAHAQPMIELPSAYPNYATLFGQTPGSLVEIAARASDEPTVLVRALAELAPEYSSVSLLGTAVRVRVMQSTANQRHPMVPHTDARGGGEMRLFYNDELRAEDGREWAKTVARGSPDLVRLFLTLYPTSPHTPVARWWLREQEADRDEQPRVAYTRSMSTVIGRGLWGRIRVRTVEHRAVKTDTGRVSGEAIEALRRVADDALIFKGRTIGGRSIEVSGALPRRYDVSRVTQFWSSNATPVDCTSSQIEAGECVVVEQAAELTRSKTPDEVGTLFVAAVLDPAVPASETLALATAVDIRMEALDAPKGAVAFRHFLNSEIPDAAASILIKRGDGAALDQPE